MAAPLAIISSCCLLARRSLALLLHTYINTFHERNRSSFELYLDTSTVVLNYSIKDRVIRTHCGMHHEFCFYRITWRQFVFGLHNHLRWPSDKKANGLSFHDQPETNSLTPEEWREVRTENLEGTRQQVYPPAALHAPWSLEFEKFWSSVHT